MDAFKKEFKHYKQRKPPPDLSHVIDFQAPEKWKEMITPVSVHSLNDDKMVTYLGLKSCSEWEVFSVKESPGFLFIRNPFLQGAQWDLVTKCLKVYSCKPNISNPDAHMEIKSSIWDISLNSFDKNSPIYKLRWVTLGYHYNWDTKTYSQDAKSEFPLDLTKLFVTVAKVLGFQSFTPEAGIINYYHLDSTLAGHTDHSEFDLEAPLFSLSLGQSAIFLLGGKTRDEAPVAMYMRSGDIMVMAGKSRLVYHAVPRVLSAPSEHQSIPPCLSPYLDTCVPERPYESREMDLLSTNEQTELSKWHRVNEKGEAVCKRKKVDSSEQSKVFVEHSGSECNSGERSSHEKAETQLITQYLSSSRININIRQVLKTGQNFPDQDK